MQFVLRIYSPNLYSTTVHSQVNTDHILIMSFLVKYWVKPETGLKIFPY
jgi:hypothetical protein